MWAPQCMKCNRPLTASGFGPSGLWICQVCGARHQVEVFPALFQRKAPGRAAVHLMVDGESSCFYHPQKKAVVPCDLCGRFLCALCDCDLNGKHFCPSCLETGKKKRSIQDLEDSRTLHRRQALVCAFLPLLITGLAAVFIALRHWNSPDSLVSPRRWAMPVALVVGILQTLLLGALIFSLAAK